MLRHSVSRPLCTVAFVAEVPVILGHVLPIEELGGGPLFPYPYERVIELQPGYLPARDEDRRRAVRRNYL